MESYTGQIFVAQAQGRHQDLLQHILVSRGCLGGGSCELGRPHFWGFGWIWDLLIFLWICCFFCKVAGCKDVQRKSTNPVLFVALRSNGCPPNLIKVLRLPSLSWQFLSTCHLSQNWLKEHFTRTSWCPLDFSKKKISQWSFMIMLMA